ncbi:MAG: hypothetical protein JW709_13040 [Sedimentisphaerales bacterium]|nr:hypothetical protein [Sedimentisphaerales bacterium]
MAAHPEAFPGIDPAIVTAQLAAFEQANLARQDAAVMARNATIAKQQAQEQLTQTVCAVVKRAEADCAATPAKLAEIGWRARRQGGTLLPPTQAKELSARHREDGVELTWRKGAGGGPVRCWLVQARTITPEGPTPWRLVEITYDTLVVLPAPPTERIEYRVIASNAAGNALPGNVV